MRLVENGVADVEAGRRSRLKVAANGVDAVRGRWVRAMWRFAWRL